MSAATRLPIVGTTVALTAAAIAAWRQPAVQEFITKYLGASASSNMLKALLAGVALVNLKNIPGFWHIRVLRGIIYQIYFQRKPIPAKHLFAPLITQSYNTLYDTDYNFHKSNSTYFADLDVARAHAVGAVVRTGLARLNAGDEEGLPNTNIQVKGKYVVALGAVSCFFQRQIEPLQSFEVYTRVLTWDRKWLYTISHIVKKGAIKPDSYVLQPWKNSKSKKRTTDEEDLTKYIFATSIARYVFKKGRLTINPEIVLERSKLLPARPEGVPYPPRTESSTNNTPAIFTPATSAPANSNPNPDAEVISSKLAGVSQAIEASNETGEESWTWDDMEKERLRGLELATHFDALSAGHNELRAGDVLGKFGDYF